jgi:hypothetical protein
MEGADTSSNTWCSTDEVPRLHNEGAEEDDHCLRKGCQGVGSSPTPTTPNGWHGISLCSASSPPYPQGVGEDRLAQQHRSDVGGHLEWNGLPHRSGADVWGDLPNTSRERLLERKMIMNWSHAIHSVYQSWGWASPCNPCRGQWVGLGSFTLPSRYPSVELHGLDGGLVTSTEENSPSWVSWRRHDCGKEIGVRGSSTRRTSDAILQELLWYSEKLSWLHVHPTNFTCTFGLRSHACYIGAQKLYDYREFHVLMRYWLAGISLDSHANLYMVWNQENA